MAGRIRFSIRTGLALGTVALVLLTAALIHIPWSYAARQGVGGLASRLNAEIIGGIADKTDGLLQSAMTTLHALAGAIEAGGVDAADGTALQRVLLAVAAAEQSVAAVELAWPDDRSAAVRRMADGALAAEETLPGPPPLRRVVLYREDAEGRLQPAGEPAPMGEYRATEEFWYRFAFLQDGAEWSNIHPLPITGEPGVTAVMPLRLGPGTTGVIAVSLALDGISAFLEGIRVSPHSLVFMTNAYGELVASQMPGDDARAMMPSTIERLDQAGLPMIRVAVAALANAGVTLKALEGLQQFTYQNHQGDTFFVALAPVAEMDLIVAVALPESDLLGEVDANSERLAYALSAFVLLAAVAAVFFARRGLARPIIAVTEEARRLGEFDVANLKPVPSRVEEIATLSGAVVQMGASLASFRRYVPVEVVRQLFSQGIEAKLGGERRELTILFMDLAGFTALSEQLGEDLIPYLGEFLDSMSETIRAGEGTIDKYIGDAVMAFWGAPRPLADHALAACRTALACSRQLARRAPEAGRPAMRARIGINTGPVLVGNVGSRERLNYTVIGDPVNVASRLESLNKLYGTTILLGEETWRRVEGRVVARRLDRVAVYGKRQGVAVYELLALAEEATPALAEWLAAFEAGQAALAAQRWDEAVALFDRVAALRGEEDGPSRLLRERALGYRDSPPPAGWDGVVVLAEK